MNLDDTEVAVERPFQDHFAQLFHRVIDDKRVGKLGLAAYVALVRVADFTTKEATARRTKLAEIARLSVRGLDAGLEELVSADYLRIERIQNIDGSWAPSKYQLLDTALAQMAVSEGVVHGVHQGGSAQPAPPPSAHDAGGVVQGVQEGGAHGAHLRRETSNKRLKNEKPAQLPLVGDGAPAPVAASLNQRANALAKRYAELVPMCKFPAVAGIAKKAIGTGLYSDDEISAAFVRLAQEGRSLTVDVLRVELEGMAPARVAGGVSRTEARVQAGMDVARRLADREAAGQ